MMSRQATKPAYTSAKDWAAEPDPFAVFFMSATVIDREAKVTAATESQALHLFRHVIEQGYKAEQKRAEASWLLLACKRAVFNNRLVRFSRDLRQTTSTMLALIDHAVSVGLVREYRAKPGSRRQSRLFVKNKLKAAIEADPHEFDPPGQLTTVELRDSETGHGLAFDAHEDVPQRVRQRLERLNEVNNDAVIEYVPRRRS